MKCHNDEKKYYKGDEPSPKGRGYCASAEKVGKQMKGNDGKMWEVVKVKNGKRWMKVKSPRASSPSRKGKKKVSPRMRHGRPGDLDMIDVEKMEDAFEEPDDMETIRNAVMQFLEYDYSFHLSEEQKIAFLVLGQTDIALLMSYLYGNFEPALHSQRHSPFTDWSKLDLSFFGEKLKNGMMPMDAANKVKEEKEKDNDSMNLL